MMVSFVSYSSLLVLVLPSEFMVEAFQRQQVVVATTNFVGFGDGLQGCQSVPAPRNTALLLSSTSATQDEETAATATSTTTTSIDESILSKLLNEDQTQTKLSLEQVQEYNTLIESLPDPPIDLDVNGGWKLLATISPEAEVGDNVDFFDWNSWQNYINGNGPSPFQSLITGSSRVSGLTQFLTTDNFDNVVEFQIGPINGKLILKASLEESVANKRVFKFQEGFFIIETLWESTITIPYPVPFNLLGDRAIGSLETIGYDPTTGIRAAIGNKGTKFIFQKSSDDSNKVISDDIELAYQLYKEQIEHDTKEEESTKNIGLTKRPVIICPQQFGGKPGDYSELCNKLRDNGHPVYLVRLTTFDWLSIVKSAFSEAYFKGELEPSVALPFYMNAINDTIQRLDESEEYTILSHSIGGWVARAWLGEVADDNTRERCKKYVSLGTPHLQPPDDSIVSKVDQTRGLLKYINDRWPGAYYENIDYTCIASKGVEGKLNLSMDNNIIDNILAYASYFALSGEGNVAGDGITPVKSALLDGSNHIVLDDCYHADVLPNPIGTRNTKLIGCQWYANKIDDWIEAL